METDDVRDANSRRMKNRKQKNPPAGDLLNRSKSRRFKTLRTRLDFLSSLSFLFLQNEAVVAWCASHDAQEIEDIMEAARSL